VLHLISGATKEDLQLGFDGPANHLICYQK